MPALTVSTVAIDDPGDLVETLDGSDPLLFQRAGDGIAGRGVAVRAVFRGASRISDAAAWWREAVRAARIDDAVDLPGSGLVAFGGFAFADDSAAESVLVVPAEIVGRRDGVAWRTTVADAPVPAARQRGAERAVSFQDGELDSEGYRAAVAEAVRLIREGGLEKAVLARDVRGALPDDADLRHPLGRLADGYPDAMTFAVDGLIGASPETLVRVSRGRVGARVLAGTAARGADEASDAAVAHALAGSAKDAQEHSFAVGSVIEALTEHASSLDVGDVFALQLPNLWHLATDIDGELADGSSSLDLVDALHPTAAVAGTPTPRALAVIARLEGFDRGRYAGPVGWVDAEGDGEWAIALRSARVADGLVTAYAGAGVVGQSDPDAELAETALKLRPVLSAFAG